MRYKLFGLPRVLYDKNTTNNNIVDQIRSVESIKTSIETTEGEGITVRRSFPTPSISYIDPPSHSKSLAEKSKEK